VHVEPSQSIVMRAVGSKRYWSIVAFAADRAFQKAFSKQFHAVGSDASSSL